MAFFEKWISSRMTRIRNLRRRSSTEKTTGPGIADLGLPESERRRDEIDVFISYASADKHVADAVCNTLESRKIRCWIAPRDVLPGKPYAIQLVRAIDAARMMVLVFSHHSNNSPQVLREVQRAAVDKGIPVVTFKTENIEPDEAMSFYLKTLHWLDAIPPTATKHLNRLARNVETLLSGKERALAVTWPGSRLVLRPAFGGRTLAFFSIGLLVVAASVFAIYRTWFADGAASEAIELERDPGPGSLVAIERPRDGEQVLRNLVYRWNPPAAEPGQVRYRIERVIGDSSFLHVTSETAFEEARPLEGPIRWRVKVIQGEGDGLREGPWTEWQRIEFYRNAWRRICATRTVRVGVGKKDNLFIRETTVSETGESRLGGYEIDLLRQLIRSRLDEAASCGTGKVAIKEAASASFGAGFFRLLENPKIDLLVSRISITDEREQKFNIRFTDPYIEYPQSIVTRAGTRLFTNGRFSLRVLGSQTASTNSWLAAELLGPGHDTVVAYRDGRKEEEIPSSPERPTLVLWQGHATDPYEVEALLDGKIEGIVADQPYALHLRRLAEGRPTVHDIEPGTVPGLANERIGFAVRFADDELRNALNRAIEDNPEQIARFATYVYKEK